MTRLRLKPDFVAVRQLGVLDWAGVFGVGLYKICFHLVLCAQESIIP